MAAGCAGVIKGCLREELPGFKGITGIRSVRVIRRDHRVIRRDHKLNLAKTPAGAPGKYIHGSPRSNPVPLGCCRDRKA